MTLFDIHLRDAVEIWRLDSVLSQWSSGGSQGRGHLGQSWPFPLFFKPELERSWDCHDPKPSPCPPVETSLLGTQVDWPGERITDDVINPDVKSGDLSFQLRLHKFRSPYFAARCKNERRFPAGTWCWQKQLEGTSTPERPRGLLSLVPAASSSVRHKGC